MTAESPNIFITLFAFVTMIGVLVVVHELGHYLVGRWFGVKADKFSVGFGPEIWSRVDKRGTRWRVAALPLGGFVQFAGDMNPASQPGDGRGNMTDAEYAQTFQSKTLWQKALIVFAGPAVNFLLAILIFMGFALTFGQRVTPPVVNAVVENSAAAAAGLKAGDKITSFDGAQISDFRDLVNAVIMVPNHTTIIEFERNGQKMRKEINVREKLEVDRFGNQYRIGQIGLGGSNSEMRSVSVFAAPTVAIKQTRDVISQQIQGLAQIISGRRSVKELGGPLKIAKISGEVFTMGLLSFISLAALISINLGFINLLPIPMLDGGHLFLYAIEAIRRRPASPQVQEWAFRAGFAMVVSFMLFVTFNDLSSFGLFG